MPKIVDKEEKRGRILETAQHVHGQRARRLASFGQDGSDPGDDLRASRIGEAPQRRGLDLHVVVVEELEERRLDRRISEGVERGDGVDPNVGVRSFGGKAGQLRDGFPVADLPQSRIAAS